MNKTDIWYIWYDNTRLIHQASQFSESFDKFILNSISSYEFELQMIHESVYSVIFQKVYLCTLSRNRQYIFQLGTGTKELDWTPQMDPGPRTHGLERLESQVNKNVI